MQETQETLVRSLGREDPLKEEMATHSRIPAWRIPMDRGAWRATIYSLCGVAKSWTKLSDKCFHWSFLHVLPIAFHAHSLSASTRRRNPNRTRQTGNTGVGITTSLCCTSWVSLGTFLSAPSSSTAVRFCTMFVLLGLSKHSTVN